MVRMLFTKAGIKTLHAWTHERLDLLFQHAATLPPELLCQEIPGFGRASVRDQLLHIVTCESGWVRGLQNLPLAKWRREDYGTAASIAQAKRQAASETLAYLDSLSEAQLNTEIESAPEEWGGPLRSPAFILHHVLTHAFHHKGQIVAMCRILGYPAPDTDLQRSES